jgi:D-psicose/D-tagatose/L-ribulose 3-epimerase
MTVVIRDPGTSISRRSSAPWPIDYRGPLTFESFSSAVVARGLSNDLAIWRNLWDDGADLAGHARRFIVDGLRDARARR